MTEKMLQKVEEIEIGPKGRYILLVNGMTAENIERLVDDLNDWWGGDKPVLVLGAAPGTEYHIERIG